MKTSYVLLAPGFEETEAIGTVDVLRRAGIPVETVSVNEEPEVAGSHSVTLRADKKLSEIKESEALWLILPGGLPGATGLHDNPTVQHLLREHMKKDGHIAAICAAPGLVLGQLGLLEGRQATVYPGFEKYCKGAKMHDQRVVVDGKLITANGPSSTLAFARAIVASTLNLQAADKVMNDMLLYPEQDKYYF